MTKKELEKKVTLLEEKLSKLQTNEEGGYDRKKYWDEVWENRPLTSRVFDFLGGITRDHYGQP